MNKRKVTLTAILLSPLSLIYWLVITFRNLLFDWELLQSREFKLPIISVGNIAVGGTGKTPHIEYLVRLLKEEFTLATLSRGYKRKTRDFQLADEQSGVSVIGDEPKQLKHKFPDIHVAVDRRRVNGIGQLLKLSSKLELVLLDDAFQHRYISAGKSILLLDYSRLMKGDFLLPSGRLREPLSARKRADIILVSKCPERIKPIELRNIVKHLTLGLHQHLFFTTMKFGEINPVFEIKTPKSKEEIKSKGGPVLLLTGIANPRDLRKFARGISTSFFEMNFPDHHAYSLNDIQKIQKKIKEINHPELLVLTTEKDAMRLQELDMNSQLKEILYYVPIHVKFLNEDEDEFNQIILNYVRSNKRNSILHKEQVESAS